MNPICPYCQNESKGVGGNVIYPNRHDLKNKWFYQCMPCEAYVGCHPNTKAPLGRLANAELRRWKSTAHKVFDQIWKSGEMTRKEAYQFLAKQMQLTPETCHIGMFNINQCKAVYAICKQRAVKEPQQ